MLLCRDACTPGLLTNLAGKDYDATAAAREEKERRELRHQAAMEKKRAKEFAECTFKPAVSRKSVEMLQTTHKERASLHTPGKSNLRTTYTGQATQVPALKQAACADKSTAA